MKNATSSMWHQNQSSSGSNDWTMGVTPSYWHARMRACSDESQHPT
jgi:hypothetical protein